MIVFLVLFFSSFSPPLFLFYASLILNRPHVTALVDWAKTRTYLPLIHRQKLGSHYLGEVTAVARATLYLFLPACSIFMCPNDGVANSVCDFWQCPLLAPLVHSPQMIRDCVCVCGRNELEACAMLAYPHVSVHFVHMHPQTI